MPKYVIEREMPGIGGASADDLQTAAQNSNTVLADLGPDVQWVHSYVTGDKIYCVYNASDEAMIRRHAEQAGFPADSIARVATTIDPTTAEG
jgi:Nickel responsive protein SCO4226-like